MNLIFKNRIEILIGIMIIILYFSLRLPNLTLQPIFADEAIYIRWAQVMRAEPTLRFLPVSDGKTPLFMWSLIPLLKIFEDPLFAGRFLSVLSGFVTLAGVFALSWLVFGKRSAFWAALIYAIVPYTVFFDRMALVDSMLAAFTIWSIFIAIWILKSQRLDLAMILGYFLGAALLTKTPAMVNLVVLPFSIIGFSFSKGKYKLLKLLGCWIVAIIIALSMYNLLRLGPEFQMLSARNADYVFSPSELSGRPLDPFVPHLRDIVDWFPKFLTWPVILFMGYGLWVMGRLRSRLGLVILIWALVPLLIQMIFLRTFTARYLLFSIPPLLILAGYGIEKITNYKSKITNKIIFYLLLVLLVIAPVRFDYLLLMNPENAPLPAAERAGYFEQWTAGYGFYDIAEFLIREKNSGPVVAGTEGSFGTLPDGLQIYLDKSGIPVIGGQSTISTKLKEAAIDNQTFFVENGNRTSIQLDSANMIMEFLKAVPLDPKRTQEKIILYQIFP